MPALKIALFGGAFDPPHWGHVQIIHYLLKQGFDQVWIIPCWRHPFGKKTLPFWQRFRLCRLAFGSWHKVRIKDIERRLHLPQSWTIDTVRYLKKKYPHPEWTLVLGQDNFEQRKKWKEFDLLEKMVSIITIPRGPGSPIMDISSTDIRQKLSQAQTIDRGVPPAVARYLVQKRPYSVRKS